MSFPLYIDDDHTNVPHEEILTSFESAVRAVQSGEIPELRWQPAWGQPRPLIDLLQVSDPVQLPLKRLDICNLRLRTNDAVALLKALKRFTVTTLSHLSLRGSRISGQAVSTLALQLKNEQCSIEFLDLSQTPTSKAPIEAQSIAFPLMRSLSRNRSLRELRLSGVGLDENGIARLLSVVLESEFSCLQKLVLSKNPLTTSPRGQLLTGVFSTSLLSHCSTLRELDMSHCRLQASGMSSLLRSRSLISINISYCQLGDEGCFALADGLPSSSIECLAIAGNQIQDEGLCALLNVLSCHDNLLYLNVDNNKFSTEGIASLCSYISNSKRLRSLSCRRCASEANLDQLSVSVHDSSLLYFISSTTTANKRKNLELKTNNWREKWSNEQRSAFLLGFKDAANPIFRILQTDVTFDSHSMLRMVFQMVGKS